MKLAMTRTGSGPSAVIGDEMLLLARMPELASECVTSVTEILARGDELIQKVEHVVKAMEDAEESRKDEWRERKVLQGFRDDLLMAPFPRPGLIFSVGGNYKAHLAEVAARTGLTIDPPKSPMGFIKNSNAVIGPGENIVLPPSFPDMIDFEAEFSFVVGKPCHNIRESEAKDYIAGYTIVNDVSARNWNEQAKRADGSMDLTMPTFGKQMPTFCPMGPVFMTADEVPDPHDVDIRLTLNGQVMQDSNTADLLFGFEKILAYFSQFFRFLPGDVLTTGSPPGVGFARNPPVFLRPGDEVAISASCVGVLRNTVASS